MHLVAATTAIIGIAFLVAAIIWARRRAVAGPHAELVEPERSLAAVSVSQDAAG
jgi:hypothetical protein